MNDAKNTKNDPKNAKNANNDPKNTKNDPWKIENMKKFEYLNHTQLCTNFVHVL